MNNNLYLESNKIKFDLFQLFNSEEIKMFVTLNLDKINSIKTAERLIFYNYNSYQLPTTFDAINFLKFFNINVKPKGQNMKTVKKNLRKIRLELLNIKKEKKIEEYSKINILDKIIDNVKYYQGNQYYKFKKIKVTKQTKNFICFVEAELDQNENFVKWKPKKHKINPITFFDYVKLF